MNTCDRLLEMLMSAAREKLAQMEAGLAALAEGNRSAPSRGPVRSEASLIRPDTAERDVRDQRCRPPPHGPWQGSVGNVPSERKQVIIAQMRMFLDHVHRQVSALTDTEGYEHSAPEHLENPRFEWPYSADMSETSAAALSQSIGDRVRCRS